MSIHPTRLLWPAERRPNGTPIHQAAPKAVADQYTRRKLARHDIFYMEDVINDGLDEDILSIREWGLTNRQEEDLRVRLLEAIEDDKTSGR